MVFDRFIKKYSESLLDEEFYELERILNLPDQLLLNIILGKEQIPANLHCETLKNLISIFSLSANFFASLLGLTLKPTRTAFEAFARETSVSFIIPISDRIIFASTSL